MMRKKGFQFITIIFSFMLVLYVLPSASHSFAEGDNDNSQSHGLKGDYYTSSGPGEFDFDERKATVVDPNIDFDDLEPTLKALTGQDDDVTVRWTGQIQPEYTEDYTFSMIGDNGFRLWVDDELIIDHWVNDWENEQVSEPISLKANQKYDIKIEFFEDYGGSNLHLRWSSSSQPKEALPRENLYTPVDFDYSGPKAAIVDQSGKTVELNFTKDINSLPKNAEDHFNLMDSNKKSFKDANLKDGDPSTVVLHLKYPITKKDSDARVVYDGNADISFTDDNNLTKFNMFTTNNSEYLIGSPWAKKVSEKNPHSKYPRPQMKREKWMNLNGKWQFERAKDGKEVPTGKQLNDEILVPFPVESRLSGIEKNIDHMWYKRHFEVPKEWNNENVLLHFGSVDWKATVYVNGHKVGAHKGGYDKFTFDITKYLRNGSNELIVKVDDTTSESHALGKQRNDPEGIWYTSNSGIWQTTWLEPVPSQHISGIKTNTDIDNDKLKLDVSGYKFNGKKIKATLLKDGEKVGSATGTADSEIEVPVHDPKLWSPDHPFLYDLKVQVMDGNKVVDEVKSYFGMREIKLQKDKDGTLRPMLNGEYEFQVGPLDQGYWPQGIYTAPTDEALKSDIQTTKQLGYNMIRKHVKIEPQRWYYWADKLGMLVWQDMPSSMIDDDASKEDKKQFKTEMRQMVKEHRNHPSIVQWVVFNEGWGQHDIKSLTNMVKNMDPTRLVNNQSGINLGIDSGAGDVIDDHCYVGPCAPDPTSSRISVNGEFGGLGLNEPGHMWAGNGSFSYDEMEDSKELTNKYIDLINQVKQFEKQKGLSAAVYTQTTDVEGEFNGLLSYDRKVLKPDLSKVREVNDKLIGTTSLSSIDNLVQRYKKSDKIDNSTAHALNLHLSVVEHYKEKNLTDKAVKHMKGFKTLLEHHKNDGSLSKRIYNILKADSNYLIKKWEK